MKAKLEQSENALNVANHSRFMLTAMPIAQKPVEKLPGENVMSPTPIKFPLPKIPMPADATKFEELACLFFVKIKYGMEIAKASGAREFAFNLEKDDPMWKLAAEALIQYLKLQGEHVYRENDSWVISIKNQNELN